MYNNQGLEGMQGMQGMQGMGQEPMAANDGFGGAFGSAF